MIPLAFVHGIAPICTKKHPYPASLFYCSILFLINSAFFFYLYHNKFFITDEDALLEKDGRNLRLFR